MSLHSHSRKSLSRRAFLGWAAAVAMAPIVARAEGACPCAQDSNDSRPKTASAPAKSEVKELRVCADPNNLPFSNRAREGFEDKIAELVARDLGLPLVYDWLPQRLGFFRTAFKTFDSNLVMAAPAGFDRALVSEPYYRSAFVFVQRKQSPSIIRSFDDEALRKVKIGVQLTGGINAPPAHALARRNIIDNITGFPAFDETTGGPGQKMISAVAAGEIDIAIIWGPQAGYFAKRQTVPLVVTPVAPREEKIGDAMMPFSFDICMAIRRPNKELRDRINGVVRSRRKEISGILNDYNVPLLT